MYLTGEQLDMEMPDVLTTTKECLDQLAEDDAFEITANLRQEIAKAAEESKQELACKCPLYAAFRGCLLTAEQLSTHVSGI